MIVLSVDSSAKTAGVALVQDGRLLYESYLATGFTHSETLLTLVDGALRLCRVQPQQVDVFALTAGPGSFTGLRIGMALVKGLAAADEKPCVPVSTLHALAAGCDAPGLIVPAMDARRNEVYTAAFLQTEQGLCRLIEDTAQNADVTAAWIARYIAAHPGVSVTLVGDGAALCLEACQKANLAEVRAAAEAVRCRCAGAAALLGEQRALAGETVPAGQLRPDYHRLCQAERERAEKLAAEKESAQSSGR